MEYLLKEDYWM